MEINYWVGRNRLIFLSLIIFAIFLTLIAMVYASLGDEILFLFLIPIFLIGWTLGPWAGLLAALSSIAISIIFHLFLSLPYRGFSGLLLDLGVFLPLTFVAGGWLVGFLSESSSGGFRFQRLTRTLGDEAMSKARQLARLNETLQTVLAAHDFSEVIYRVADEVIEIIQSDGMYVLLFDKTGKLKCAAARGLGESDLEGQTMELKESQFGENILAAQTVQIPDIQLGELFQSYSGLTSALNIKTLFAAPLLYREESIGTLLAAFEKNGNQENGRQELIETAANWAATALGNARSQQELERKLQERSALNAISQALGSTLDLEEILALIVESAQNIIPHAEQVVIHLYDQDFKALRPAAVTGLTKMGDPGYTMRPGEGVAGIVVEKGVSINVGDIEDDERYVKYDTQPVMRSLLVAPVRFREKSLGTISAQSRRPNAFNIDDEGLLETLGLQAALAIENARLFETEKRRVDALRMLHRSGLDITAQLDLASLLQTIVERAALLLNSPMGRLFIYHPKDQTLELLVSLGHTRNIKGARIKYGEGHVGVVAEKKVPVVIRDYADWPDRNQVDSGESVRSWVGAPIIWNEQLLGVISLADRRPNIFEPRHIELVSQFAVQAGVAIVNARLIEETRRQLDELTNLHGNLQEREHFLSMLNDITRAALATPDLQTMLHVLADQIIAMFDADATFISLLDKRTMPASSVRSGRTAFSAERMEFEEQNLIEAVVVSDHALSIPDVHGSPLVSPSFLDKLPCKSLLGLPLVAAEQRLGSVVIAYENFHRFSDDEMSRGEQVARQIALAVYKSKLLEGEREQRELAEELRMQEEATRDRLVLHEKLATVGRLTASVAHELNNPLQAIQNALYLVTLDKTLTSVAREDLEVAVAEAGRMATLIARLRETYRPSSNQEFELLSFNDLIVEVEKLISTHLRHNEVEFVFTPAADISSIPVLRDQMKQVVLNLCMNAVESMPDGGVLSINTKPASDGGLTVSVSDTGVGISPADLPFIFDPFFTTKEGGTGLGLAIIYEIINRHNGIVDVRSTPGIGTTFEIQLPENPDQPLGLLGDGYR